MEVVIFLLGAVLGFILGVLVLRNNFKKLSKLIDTVEFLVEEVKNLKK